MCGIAGFFSKSPGSDQETTSILTAMTGTLRHRGPDDAGEWVDAQAGVALGHRRLSIIDLSPHGHQPMVSACRQYVIAYNGEVYNFEQIRRELEPFGHKFNGSSDTEVILAAMIQWGIKAAVQRFVGMFALALWDRKSRTLSLVRDRLGIKPLYYGWHGDTFLFGSELKALKIHPDFNAEIDRRSLTLYFRHNYIPAPGSIYKGICKLEPGMILTMNAGKGEAGQHIECYWSAREIWAQGAATPFTGSDTQAVEQLEHILSDAIRLRMIADVPLGAFLSGGVDSSTVVALMQANSTRPVKTFSIGFHEARYNEAAHAKAVAAHLGTEHTELYVTPDDLLAVVPDIAHFWDEPFADSSQIPTQVVSQLARQHVTVSLSGDGGDELFSGYDRYFWTRKISGILAVPLSIRKATAGMGKMLPESIYRLLGPKGTRIRWRLDLLQATDLKQLYLYLISHFKDPEKLVINGEDHCILDAAGPGKDEPFRQMQLWDTTTYLPDDILTKVDRASMSVSLESRVPILDHRVVAFAASLPLSMRVRDNQGKWLLRQLLYKHVPPGLIDRPKMGFGVPIEHWLKNELHDWAQALLDESLIRRQGYLDAARVRHIWNDYVNGQGNWYYYLWDILMFQAWLEKAGL